MNTLVDRLRHNAWANHVVLSAIPGASFLEQTDHSGETLRERARHFVGVERAFLDVLRGAPARPEPPAEIAELVRYQDETGAGFVTLVGPWDAPDAGREVYVPWWEQAFPAHVLVDQVVAHSAQHRSELAWELARAGTNTGEIDYIAWRANGEPAPGAAGGFS